MKKIWKKFNNYKHSLHIKVAFLIVAFILVSNVILAGSGITNEVSKIFYYPDEQGVVAGESAEFPVRMVQVYTPQTYISTGALLGGGRAPTLFYTSSNGVNWLPTYSGAQYEPEAEGKLMNFRAINAIFDDANKGNDGCIPASYNAAQVENNTDEFINQLSDYRDREILAFTVGLQGGLPGLSTECRAAYDGTNNTVLASAFDANGNLDNDWKDRMERIIEAADAQGMVVIVSYFYQRQAEVFGGNDTAVEDAVTNATNWLINDRDYHNIIIEIANEYNHIGFVNTPIRDNIGDLVTAAKTIVSNAGSLVPVSVSGQGGTEVVNSARQLEGLADIDLYFIHGNNVDPGDDISNTQDLVSDGLFPVVMNEDNNGWNASDGDIDDEVDTASGILNAGGSWGLMWYEYNQAYPFEWALGDPNNLSTDAGYFAAVLDGIKGLVEADTISNFDITITDPPSGTTGGKPTISGDITLPVSMTGSARVRFYIDGSQVDEIPSVLASTQYTYTYDTLTGTGPHTLMAEIEYPDRSGITRSDSIVYNYYPVEITSPADGDINGPDLDVYFTVNYAPITPLPASNVVIVEALGTSVSCSVTGLVTGDSDFCTLSNLPVAPGGTTYTIRATMTVSGTVVEIDEVQYTARLIQITAPPDGTTGGPDVPVSYTTYVTDDVDFRVDGSTSFTSTGTCGGGSLVAGTIYTCNVSNLAVSPPAHTMTATLSGGGSIDSDSITYNVLPNCSDLGGNICGTDQICSGGSFQDTSDAGIGASALCCVGGVCEDSPVGGGDFVEQDCIVSMEAENYSAQSDHDLLVRCDWDFGYSSGCWGSCPESGTEARRAMIRHGKCSACPGFGDRIQSGDWARLWCADGRPDPAPGGDDCTIISNDIDGDDCADDQICYVESDWGSWSDAYNQGRMLNYTFEVDTTGRWYVWIHAFAIPDEGDNNGIYLVLDGNLVRSDPLDTLNSNYNSSNPPASPTYDQIYFYKRGEWHWNPEWKCGDGCHWGPIYVDIDTPGTHTLSLVQSRMQRPIIDKIILTSEWMPGADTYFDYDSQGCGVGETTGTLEPCILPLITDFNCDDVVDVADFGILLSHWGLGATPSIHNYSHPNCGGTIKDLDVAPDDEIRSNDMAILLSCWGSPFNVEACTRIGAPLPGPGPGPGPGPTPGPTFITINYPTNYDLAWLQDGMEYYVDRTYTINDLGPFSDPGDMALLRTGNIDKDNSSPDFLSFTPMQPVNVYVAYDDRISPPGWLTTSSWDETGDSIGVTDDAGQLNLYRYDSVLDTGDTLILGGNACPVGACSMYVVIFEPVLE